MNARHRTCWICIVVDHADGSNETWELKDDGSLVNTPKRVRRCFKVGADNIRRPCTIHREGSRHTNTRKQVRQEANDDVCLSSGADESSGDVSPENYEVRSNDFEGSNGQAPEDQTDGFTDEGFFEGDGWSAEYDTDPENFLCFSPEMFWEVNDQA